MSSRVRWVAVLAIAAAVGLVVWVLSKRGGRSQDTDAVIMSMIERELFPEARRAVSRHCDHLLPVPVVAVLRFECETMEESVKLTRAAVLPGDDGGTLSPELVACVTEALAGLEAKTKVPPGAPNAATAKRPQLPAGRAYELDVELEFAHVDPGGYFP